LAVHDHRRVEQQTVARVVGLGTHERTARQAEHLEHRRAASADDAETNPEGDPDEEARERDPEPARNEHDNRHRDHERGHPATDGTERARHDLRRGDALHTALDLADRPFEQPSDHATAHVAGEAAEHSAQALEAGARGAETAREPETGRRTQHDHEQPYAFDEHQGAPESVVSRRRGTRAEVPARRARPPDFDPRTPPLEGP
jgi:hypothetical protein